MNPSTGPALTAALALLREGECTSGEVAAGALGLQGPAELLDKAVRTLLSSDPRVVEVTPGRWRRSGAADGEPGPGALNPAPPHTLKGLPLQALPWVVVDVETTGSGRAEDHRITEVAAVELKPEGPGRHFQSLVNPRRPIPPRIVKLTGIHDEMVRSAPTFREVAPSLAAFLEGRVFVAHNAPFDWSFLAREFQRVGEAFPIMPRVCTVRLARRLLPGLDRYDLGTITWALAIPVEARHRALGDAQATALLMARLLDEARHRELADLPSLLDYRP
ncbi:MAG: 3'-5' exonuclease [Gemmatimonadota bacterium]